MQNNVISLLQENTDCIVFKISCKKRTRMFRETKENSAGIILDSFYLIS